MTPRNEKRRPLTVGVQVWRDTDAADGEDLIAAASVSDRDEIKLGLGDGGLAVYMSRAAAAELGRQLIQLAVSS